MAPGDLTFKPLGSLAIVDSAFGVMGFSECLLEPLKEHFHGVEVAEDWVVPGNGS